MAEALFLDSRMKLERADQFIKELEANLEDYRRSDPFKVRIDANQHPPVMVIDWAAVKGLPGAIVGDAVHNIRTALDLMASELVRMSQKSNKNVYFPFSETAETLDGRIKDKNFHKAGRDAVDLLKTFAPYKGGNELLRALHDLDVQDKHRALVVANRNMNIQIAGSYNIDSPTENDLTVVGHDVHYIFPDDGPLAGRIIVQTLKDMMELVNGIIESFSRLVGLREAKAS